MNARIEYTILQLAHRLSNSGYSAAAIQAAEGLLRRLNRPEYAVSGEVPAGQQISYTGIEFQAEDGYTANPNSIFNGALVFDPLTIDNGEDSLFLDGAVFGVSMQKNLVKTKIQGRQGGTVKELVGNGDYSINVTGVFIRPFGEYPYEEVETLNRIWKSEATLEITNELLNRLGITTCVIDGSPSLPSGQFINVQEYSFQMTSDEPPELLLK